MWKLEEGRDHAGSGRRAGIRSDPAVFKPDLFVWLFQPGDFARAGIGSAKDYDYGMKLIRAIFPDSEQAAVWQDGRKYPALRAPMWAVEKTG